MFWLGAACDCHDFDLALFRIPLGYVCVWWPWFWLGSSCVHWFWLDAVWDGPSFDLALFGEPLILTWRCLGNHWFWPGAIRDGIVFDLVLFGYHKFWLCAELLNKTHSYGFLLKCSKLQGKIMVIELRHLIITPPTPPPQFYGLAILNKR